MSVLSKRIAAALAAAIVSAIGGMILLYGPELNWKSELSSAATTGLVIVATVVGTLRSGRGGSVVGPLPGAVPLSVIVWFGVDLTAEAQSGLVGITVAFAAFFVSTTSWALTLMVIHKGAPGRIWGSDQRGR